MAEIESLELEIVSNSTSAAQGIDALTQSLTKLKSATKNLVLDGVAKDMGKIADATKRAASEHKKASQAFTSLYRQIKGGAKLIKSFGKGAWSAIKESMEYTENMNLFSVAMGEYAQDAYDYAEIVSDAMGIDTSEWIRAQGVFMTLSTGFGVAGDRAAKMSKNLTQLGYDLSSFYNISTDDAMQKLQSGLSGELEPLRRLGYDLSQAKLEATALELGIDKSVSSMTQAEKAQLRYYAIMTQVTQAQGDMARTLDDPANQVRVLKAQVTMAAREIGNAFIPALNAIIPYATAAAQVIGSLGKIIARIFGYESEGIGETSSSIVENTDAMSENLSDAKDEAKKLKSYMLGIDELNVINPNEGSTEDTSDMFEFELPEYDFMNGLVESKVATIVEEMKEWLGITEDIDSWSELFETRLGNILVVVGAIGAGLAAWKIGATVVTAVNAITSLINAIKASPIVAWITSALPVIAPYILPVLGILAGIVSYIWGMVDAIKEGIDWIDALAIALGSTLAGAAIGFLVGGPAGAGIGALIGLAVGLITDFTIWLWQKFDEIEAWFMGLPTWGKVIVGLIGAIVIVVNLLIGAWIPALIALVITFIKKWDDIKTMFSKFAGWFYTTVIEPIVGFFTPIVDAVTSVTTYAISKIAEITTGVIKAIASVVLKIAEVYLKIVEIVKALGKAFYDYIMKPVIDWIAGLAKKFYDLFVAPVVELLKMAGTWVYENMVVPIVDKLTMLKDAAIVLFKAVGITVVDFISNLFKSVINGILWQIESTINSFIRMLNSAISVINAIPGVSISQVSELSIPRLAEGGFPAQGQMFIAREAGAEMVGSIGRRTAVANNDQIVAGIAGGVAEANEEQNSLLREQNTLLRALLEKDGGVYLDGKHLTNSVEKYQRERGRVLITGGVV